jgi:hypothetical protein
VDAIPALPISDANLDVISVGVVGGVILNSVVFDLWSVTIYLLCREDGLEKKCSILDCVVDVERR